MQIIDVVTFNGEHDLLEIRLNILKDYVDQFIIVEAPTTFSGKPKPLYFKGFLAGIKSGRFNINPDTLDKIKYHVIDEEYTSAEIALAEYSPNTQGASHWKHEFLQKESIKKALTHLKDDDIVYIGDVDEVWNPEKIHPLDELPIPGKLKLMVYSYYLNNRSNEDFWGTLQTRYKWIKHPCLNHQRTTPVRSIYDYGWHFTSIGGYPEVRRKLLDSYTEETYANAQVMNNLEENIEEGRDFLGRNFTYKIDESDLPKYIKDNKQRYAHLFK